MLDHRELVYRLEFLQVRHLDVVDEFAEPVECDGGLILVENFLIRRRERVDRDIVGRIVEQAVEDVGQECGERFWVEVADAKRKGRHGEGERMLKGENARRADFMAICIQDAERSSTNKGI